MRLRGEWKQTISRSDAWKAILLTIILLSGILAFGRTFEHSHYGHLAQEIALLIIWGLAAVQVFKRGWRSWELSQTLLLVGYTLFAGGPLLPQGQAISWLTNVGGLLLMGAWADSIFDFRKSRASASAATLPPSP